MEGVNFSTIFQPTTLFSLKDSNSTNAGAKSLFLPSPYAIKMAILNQAITLNGINFEENGKMNERFQMVRDMKISYFLKGSFCVNNCFIKIQRIGSDKYFTPTISFREYIHINSPIEFIFTVKDEEQKSFLQSYLHKINYFGKRGCFFQFLRYTDEPNEPNVIPFNSSVLSSGILQEYDDFNDKLTFDHVNNYGGKASVKREKSILVLPLFRKNSSKSFTHYEVKK